MERPAPMRRHASFSGTASLRTNRSERRESWVRTSIRFHGGQRRYSLLISLFLIHPVVATGQDAAAACQPPVPGCVTSRPVPPLPATAEQVAREIGVFPLVERVRALAATCAPAGGMSLEELSLRQQITEAVLTASLDVHEVIAEISYEQAQIMGLQDRLSSAKSNKVNTLTLAGILVGSGTSAIGTGMGLNNATAKAGDWVQVFGGTGGIILSILALNAQGGTGYLPLAPNMLAPLFGRESEKSSIYPQDVWTYLNTVPAANPREKVPWKEQLINEWVKAGRIGPPTAPASQAKIDRLTSGIANRKRLSIGDLTDRNAMLADVRSRVSLMNRDLRDLTRAVSIPTR
jgi:hypothetical protein